MDPNQSELVLGAYALTYLVHSTLLIVGVWLSLKLLKLKSPRIREKLWRTALLGGLLTASLQFLLPLPHWGVQWFLDEQSEIGNGLPVRAPFEQPNIDVSGLVVASDSLHERSNRDSSGASASTAKNARWSFWRVAAWVWLGAVAIGAFRLGLQFYRFKQICRRSQQASQGIQSTLGELSQNMQHHGTVHCRSLSGLSGPIAAGWLNGWIILPEDLCRRLQPEQFRAVLAHELAHLARHDSWWSLLTHVVGATFFFQPLNQLVRRQLRIEAEYLADQHALKVLPDSLGLAQCLIAVGESLTKTPRGVPALAAGMASYHSILGKRVESLVKPNQASQRAAKWTARITGALALIIPAVILIAAPRVLATPTLNPNNQIIIMNTMKKSVTLLAASLGLTAFEPAAKADEPEREAPRRAPESIAKVPESLRGFSGHVAGELVSKDVEKGELVMKLNRVLHVWKPNKAKEPSSGIGKTFRIDGVTGKFLDDLLVIKPGEFLKIEVHHVKGDDLAFLGEGLNKIPKEEGTLLDAEQAAWAGLKDFRGILIGKLVSKDTEKGTLVFKMEKVKKTWKANKAPNPTAAVGKELLVKGISGKWLDVLLLLEKDDRIEVEAFHNGKEHLDFVQEWLKKAEEEEKETKE